MSRKHELPTPTDDHDKKLLGEVKEYGWHVIGVEEGEEGPGFSYTIGLFYTFDHPEIIVFGLDVRLMHQIVNGIGEQIKKGARFEHLNEAGDVLEGYNVIFQEVQREHYREYLGFARWFYQGDDFPVLQCVWPDKAGRYPWHPAAHKNFVTKQRVLSVDKTWPFHEGKNRATFTTRQVIEEDHPILLVSHDVDGDWQFLCGTTSRSEDAKIVSLGSALKLDPTIAELADLSEGWRAERPDVKSPWRRSKAKDEL